MIEQLDACLVRMIRLLSSAEAVGRLACTCQELSTPEPEFEALGALVPSMCASPFDCFNELSMRSNRRSLAIDRGSLAVKAANSRCMQGLTWALSGMEWEEQYRQAYYIALAAVCAGWSDGFLWIASWAEEQPRSKVDAIVNGDAIGCNGILGGGPCSSNLLEEAVAQGQVRIVRWLLARIPAETDLSDLAFVAASSGDMVMLKMLRGQPGVDWDAAVWVGAARGGHVHVLDWLVEIDCERGALEGEFEAAAEGLQEWIASKKVPFTAVSFKARSAVVVWLGQ
jgi:hypothetical protein